MTSLFGKARQITLGNLHEWLDHTVDMNSIPVLKQQVRDIEDSLEKLRREAAVAAGQVRTLNRQRVEVDTEISHLTDVVKNLLTSGAPNAETVAKTQTTRIALLKQKLATLTTQIATQTQMSENLDQAVRLLDDKHTQFVNRIQELQTIDGGAKAKEHAVEVMKMTNQMLANSADSSSIDNLESRIRARGDVADEAFTRELARTNETQDPTIASAGDAELEAIKASMNQPQAAAAE